MDGVGRTLVRATAQLNISGNSTKWLYRRLENAGRGTWTGAGDIIFANGDFQNLAGAVFQAENAGNIRWNGGVNTFDNAGTFLKTGTNQTAISTVPFNNSGALNVSQGSLGLNGGTNSGSFRIEAGASLALNAGTYSLSPGVNFTGSGTVEVLSSTRLTLASDLNLGTLNIVFRDLPTVTGPFKLSNSAGGTITFNASVTIPGSMEIGGTLAIAATNVTVQISGTLTLAQSATLNNAGTLRVGAFQDNGGTIIGNGPQSIGLGSQSIRLLNLGFARLDPQSISSSTLQWAGTPAAEYKIEVSADLLSWSVLEVPIVELAPGIFQGRLSPDLTSQPRSFLRVRLTQK